MPGFLFILFIVKFFFYSHIGFGIPSNINFSDQNCLTRYNSNALRGETGPTVNQYILGHKDVLINDKHVFVNANTCTFLRITLNFIKKKTTGLSFPRAPSYLKRFCEH